jgi:hypothetical protein
MPEHADGAIMGPLGLIAPLEQAENSKPKIDPSEEPED